MKLSLKSLLNEIKMEQVAQRATSKGFLNALIKWKQLFYYFPKNHYGTTDQYREFLASHPESLKDIALLIVDQTASAITNSDISEQNKGLALQWLMSAFVNGGYEHSTIHLVGLRSAQGLYWVEKYFQLSRYVREKNLMNIKTLNQLIEEVRAASQRAENDVNNPSKKKKIEELKKRANYEKVISNEQYDVFVPHNKEAAQFLGLGTKWCTAATESENYYEHYHAPHDPLMVIFDKINNKKYQFHSGTEQFMDSEDHQIRDPELLLSLKKLVYPFAKKISSWQTDEEGTFVIKDADNNVVGKTPFKHELKNIDLSGTNFKNKNLANKYYEGMENVKFDGANLHSVDFQSIRIMKNVSFVNANLRFATFAMTTLRKCDFSGVVMTGVNFHSAVMDSDTLESLLNAKYVGEATGLNPGQRERLKELAAERGLPNPFKRYGDDDED